MKWTGVYPITIAELVSYAEDADKFFTGEEHDRLKEFLALHPWNGDLIPGSGGVRKLLWALTPTEKRPEVQVIYFFHDLNMPLYLLAMYVGKEQIEFDDEWCQQFAMLVGELVEEHSKRWACGAAQQDKGA